MQYTVRYHAGPYAGVRTVEADDEEEALAKVRGAIRGQMTLAMYSDSYKIVNAPCQPARPVEEDDE
jgi:hypothetical protein